MSTDSLDAFFGQLEQSHLLTDEQIAATREHVAQHRDSTSSQKLARWLIDRAWLTRWQAKMLLSGRKAFFFGKYKLLDQLGQGGMGAVFRAEQSGFGRVVALKLMAKELLRDKAAVARFHREMQAAAALTHPNIVAAYDADCVKDTHFLVMEYVEGKTLDEIARKRGQLPIDEACEYIRQAALGLQHAHERGMVHRDIKPANLLVARDADDEPVVKILDMGLARFSSELNEEGGLTKTGQIMGTPDYIAPEQARNTKGADIRSDIFSLGCSLYRLLAGELPFRGETVMAKLMARSLHDAPRIKSLRPEIPPALDALVAKTLARDPAERFQTPAELAAALAPFAGRSAGGMTTPASALAADGGSTRGTMTQDADLSDRAPRIDPALDQFLQQLATDIEEPAQAAAEVEETSRIGSGATRTSASVPQNVERPAAKLKQGAGARIDRQRRQERHRIMIAGAVVAAIVVGFASAMFWYRAGETLLVVDLPESERQMDSIEIDGVKRSLPKKGALKFTGRGGRRSVRLARPGYVPVAEELNFDRGETRTFRPDWQPTAETARRMKLSDLKRRVEQHKSRDPHAAETRLLRSELNSLARERFGTADERLALELMPRLAWPADALRREDVPAEELSAAGHGDPAAVPAEIVAILGDSRLKHWGKLWFVAYTDDGALATAGDDNLLHVWDAATGRLRRTLTGGDGAFAVAANGKWAAARNRQGSITLWNLATGESRIWGDEIRARPESLAFNRDASQIAAGMTGGEIVVWSLADLKLQSRFSSGGTRVSRLIFNPSGTLLAGFGDDLKVRVWTVGDGTVRHVFSTAGNRLRDLAFHPAGKLLACGMWLPEENGVGTAQIWDVETGREIITFPKFVACSSVAFSPDGRLFAAGMGGWDNSGHVHCWEIDGWRPLWRRHVSGGEMAVYGLTFSPDSRVVAAAGETGRVHLLDAESGEPRPRLDQDHAAYVSSVAWSPDGETVVSGSYDTTAIVWDVARRSPRHTLRGHQLEVYAVRFSPDGRTIATTGRDGRVILWDAETGAQRQQMFGHNYRVGALAFSPDGKILVSGGWDRQTILWDVAKGLELKRLPKELDVGASCLDFSNDGRFLAIATSGTDAIVALWEVSSLRRQQVWKGFSDSVLSVEFTPDGKQLHAAGAPVKRFDVKTGSESTIPRNRPVFLSFSPDGRRAAMYDGARLVVTAADLLDEQFSLPMGYVRQAAFSPDGKHLATANTNGTVYLVRLP